MHFDGAVVYRNAEINLLLFVDAGNKRNITQIFQIGHTSHEFTGIHVLIGYRHFDCSRKLCTVLSERKNTTDAAFAAAHIRLFLVCAHGVTFAINVDKSSPIVKWH